MQRCFTELHVELSETATTHIHQSSSTLPRQERDCREGKVATVAGGHLHLINFRVMSGTEILIKNWPYAYGQA